jgi:hypothetical protein
MGHNGRLRRLSLKIHRQIAVKVTRRSLVGRLIGFRDYEQDHERTPDGFVTGFAHIAGASRADRIRADCVPQVSTVQDRLIVAITGISVGVEVRQQLGH